VLADTTQSPRQTTSYWRSWRKAKLRFSLKKRERRELTSSKLMRLVDDDAGGAPSLSTNDIDNNLV
jgi:hypothetical protein